MRAEPKPITRRELPPKESATVAQPKVSKAEKAPEPDPAAVDASQSDSAQLQVDVVEQNQPSSNSEHSSEEQSQSVLTFAVADVQEVNMVEAALPEVLEGAVDPQLDSGEALDTHDNIDNIEAVMVLDTGSMALPAQTAPVIVSGVGGNNGNALTANKPANAADAQLLAVTQAIGGLGEQTEESSVENIDAAVEVLAVSDSSENPDFLLLNSKAVLNKLAETSMTAPDLDKGLAAELLKPTAANPAVETLVRLTEAQSPAARAFVVQTGMPVAMGSPQWSQAVGDKVLWLAAQNVSAAEIRLDPPELGPLQVKVSVSQDQANVTFISPHPAVREALDQQLNRLREMFSEQGLNLVNVDVSDKSFAQREQEESSQQQANAGLEEEELVPTAVSQIVSNRLVDHYA